MELPVTSHIRIPAENLKLTYVRSRGPGGQNVNKVNTCAQLRFDLRHCQVLPADAKHRLANLAGSRLTSHQEIILECDRHRERLRNRQECLDRLADLIGQALIRPKVRRPTKPSRAAKERRLQTKKRRSQIKSLRRSRPGQE